MGQSHPVILNIHKTCTFMLLAGFELAVLLSERPQTYAFESSATGTCNYIPSRHVNKWFDGWGGGGRRGGGDVTGADSAHSCSITSRNLCLYIRKLS